MSSESFENSTDQQLVEALNQGDVEAFTALYARYRDWVLRLAWRFTGHHDDALDVVQETFAYLVRKFPGFQLTAAMTTFLYPAVRHLAIAANRRRRRSCGAELDPELYPELYPAVSTDGDSFGSELASVLSSLNAAHREILLMRFVDDMTQAEIAAALGVPQGTVKSRLHHAVQSLKQQPQVLRLLGHEPASRSVQLGIVTD